MSKYIEDQNRQLLRWISSHSDDIYEDAPCGFLFALPDGHIIKANRTLAEWLGFKKDDLLTQHRFQDVLTVGSRIYYETHYAPLLRIQGFLNEVTLDLRSKNNQPVPVLINSSEIKDGTGKVVLIRSTLFNISERRKYEKELLIARDRAEQSERRFSFLAAAGETLRSSYDYLHNFVVLTRRATERFCDACSVELITDGRVDRIAESHRFANKTIPAVSASDELTMQEQPILVNELTDRPNPDFEIQSFLSVPLFHGQFLVGRVCFYMIELGRKFSDDDLQLAVELSKRCAEAIESATLQQQNQKTTEALRESHEWFATTLRSIGDAVITVGTDKKISFMNQVAGDLTGWSPADAEGKAMDEVFKITNDKTGEPATNPVERVFREAVVVALENHTALIRRDGSKRIIEDSAAPIKNSVGQVIGVVLVFRDITEKYAEEQRRQKTLETLREERVVRDKFVATLTHDLRSPITAVKMNAQLILEDAEPSSRVRAQALRVIKSVNRADQMIQNLLDANRIRAGEKIPLQMEACDFAAEIREAIMDLTTIHGKRFVYEGESEAHGIWNGAGLRRIVENLCGNAVKYGFPKAPIIVRLTKTENSVMLAVHNEGNAIKPEDQATLFEAYRRTASAQSSGQIGWGLGLTLVRGVAEAHGGEVSVESREEHGTTFYVVLPFLSGN